MTRYTDAALLKGQYAHLAAEMKAGMRPAPSPIEWGDVSRDNTAEEVAQEVAKHIFSFQQELDPVTEQMEIVTFSAVGMMKVSAVVPGDGDLIRLDGVLLDENIPVSVLVHASSLDLTFMRNPVGEANEDDDALTIGYVIFDELKERQKARYSKDKTNRKTTGKTASKTGTKTQTGAKAKSKAAKSKPKAVK